MRNGVQRSSGTPARAVGRLGLWRFRVWTFNARLAALCSHVADSVGNTVWHSERSNRDKVHPQYAPFMQALAAWCEGTDEVLARA